MPQEIMPHRVTVATIPAVAERRMYHIDFGDSAPVDVDKLIAQIKDKFESATIAEVPPTEVVLTEDQALHNVETAVARAQAVGAIPEALQPITDAVPVDPEHKAELHDKLFPPAVMGEEERLDPHAQEEQDWLDSDVPAIAPIAAFPFDGTQDANGPSFAAEGGQASVEFQKDLEALINKHSIENMLGMPDFVVAEMMCNQLNATAHAVWRATKWKR